MTLTQKDPIHLERTSCEHLTAIAASVTALLANYQVQEIPGQLTPFLAAAGVLAAAGAEVALVADIRWRFSGDDAVVALLRLITKGTMAKPDATGPHVQRLFEQLEKLDTASQA